MLSALFIVCAARPLLLLLGETRFASRATRISRPPAFVSGALALVGAVAFVGLVVAAGIPARPEAEAATAPSTLRLPEITFVDSRRRRPDRPTHSRRIARDVVADLRSEADALRLRSRDRAAAGATGEWLSALWQRIDAANGERSPCPSTTSEAALTLQPGDNQGPPTVVALLRGTVVVSAGDPEPFRRTVELALERGRYRISRSQGGVAPATTTTPAAPERVGRPRRRRARGRLGGGRARLPPRGLPLRSLGRRDGDDGRRTVLAGL